LRPPQAGGKRLDLEETAVRKAMFLAASALLAIALSAGVAAAGNGPPHVGFYVDGDQYRTVGTPTNFSGTGAPAGSFDIIYALGDDANGDPLLNVAEAKPGDTDYNGGRWSVLPVTWTITPVQLTSAEEVLYYASQGWLTIADEPAAMFECPVIPLQGNH
jgi:hypothetical protein